MCSGIKLTKRFGLFWSYNEAEVILLLYQVVAEESPTFASVYGLEEFVFGQELSNCNPNELDSADELW